MSFFGTLWSRIKTAVEGEAKAVEAVITPVEQAVIEEGGLFFKQVESTLGEDGIALVKSLLQAGLATMVGGGPGLSDVISNVVEQALVKVSADVVADAKNAIYGLVAILLPAVQAQATTGTPA